jgi:hypothetical protein
MRSGRPPKGLKHVDDLPGDPESKERLRVILATLSGEVSLAKACVRLGLSETRFLQLRRRTLEGALAAAGPGVPGRPACEQDESGAREVELEHEVKELKQQLVMEEVRTQIALVKPELLERAVVKAIKKKARERQKSKKDRKGKGR